MFTSKTSSASARALVPSRSVAAACGVAIVAASGAFLSGCAGETSDINDLTAPTISADQLPAGVSQLSAGTVAVAGNNTTSMSGKPGTTHIVVACVGGSVELSFGAKGNEKRLTGKPQACTGKPFTYELPASEGDGSLTLKTNGDIAATVVYGTTK